MQRARVLVRVLVVLAMGGVREAGAVGSAATQAGDMGDTGDTKDTTDMGDMGSTGGTGDMRETSAGSVGCACEASRTQITCKIKMACKRHLVSIPMPKAVAYHEPTVMRLFMIGHSLGRMEMCFDIESQHLGCWGQNTSRIQH